MLSGLLKYATVHYSDTKASLAELGAHATQSNFIYKLLSLEIYSCNVTLTTSWDGTQQIQIENL